MKIKIQLGYRGLMSAAMFLYLFFAILCINAPKRISFVLAIFAAIPILTAYLIREPLIMLFGAIYPTVLILISILVSGDLTSSIQRTYCLYSMLLVIPIIYCHFDYEKWFLRFTWLICLLIIGTLVLDLLGVIDINSGNLIRNIVYKFDMGLMGKGTFASAYFPYSIFLYTNTLMYFLFFKYLDQGNWFLTFTVFLAFYATGERAPFFLCIFAGLIFYYFIKRSDSNNKRFLKIIITVLIIIAVVFLIQYIWNRFYHILFVAGEGSNNARLYDINAILNTFRSKPSTLLTGQGMGSEFYNPGRHRWNSDSELSYLNLIRMMGIPFFCFFMWMILLPFKFMNKEDPYFWAYICYLIQAGVNPFLFDSTAFLVYVFVYSKYVIQNRQLQIKEEMQDDICYHTQKIQ